MKQTQSDKGRQLAAAFPFVMIGLMLLLWCVDFVWRSMGNAPEGGIITAEQATTEQAEATGETDAAPEETLNIQNAEHPTPTEPEAPGVPEGYVTIPQDTANIYNGMLLQLDAAHGFTGISGTQLTTFAEKNDSYRMKNLDLQANVSVVSAMNEMCKAYQAEIGAANLMVYSTLAVYEKAGSLYQTVLPDRATGYCVDLCLLHEDGTISSFTEQNAWLAANCHRYGFIFSYTQAEEAATGVAAAPYHLRYVGKIHAGLMQEQKLGWNGYCEFLKSHTLDAPLYYTVDEVRYITYYVPAGDGMTEVPVPKEAEYTISGNNTDGYIVTAVAK